MSRSASKYAVEISSNDAPVLEKFPQYLNFTKKMYIDIKLIGKLFTHSFSKSLEKER